VGSVWVRSCCGVTAIKPVVSGLARIVSLQRKSLDPDKNGWHFCDKSIISQDWVVNAAHCGKTALLVMGLWKQGGDLWNTPHTSEGDVGSNLDSDTYYTSSTSLIKLATPLHFSDTVSTFCLPSSTDDFPAGSTSVATGWGLSDDNNSIIPKKLQQAALPLISNTQCNKFWWVKDVMICAGTSGVSTGMDDSGGPLVYQKDGAWNLVGIVSGGSGTCSTSILECMPMSQNLCHWYKRSWLPTELPAGAGPMYSPFDFEISINFLG
uniref:chymotrypsin n=1 Tax=Monodelphis domestica TaxID=13616 RepID=F7DNK8_MONDO